MRKLKKDKSIKENLILIIGAGNLGSRHLQGILKMKLSSSIFVIDPSQAALDLSRSRASEIKNHIHKLFFMKELPTNIKCFDVTVISTTSNGRSKLIREINKKYQINAWIIEKIIAQSSQELKDIKRELKFSNKVWVNVPRRIMPWYSKIKDKLIESNNNLINFEVSGGSWDIACNAIHFIDLFSWITGCKIIEIDTNGIKDWIPSRRENYFEAIGSIKITFDNKSYLNLTCNDNEDEISILINTSQGQWIINENKGIATLPNSEVIKGRIQYQSELSGIIIDRIITTGKCDLPDILESTEHHMKMIDSFLCSWNKLKNRNDTFIKVT